jgi:hypothetical protein
VKESTVLPPDLDIFEDENVYVDRRQSAAISVYDLWAEDVSLYRMWFEFLVCSPSFETAGNSRLGLLTDEEVAKLPSDFDVVLEVWDNLGPIVSATFREWWDGWAKGYFAAESSAPRVQLLGPTHLSYKSTYKSDFERRKSFPKEIGWARETSKMLIFSTALKRKDVMKSIKSQLLELEFEQKPDDSRKPIYQLGKIGKMRPALQKYLTALKMRGRYPDEELWGIGVRAELNKAAKEWPKLDGVPQKLGPDECQLMSIITSRALFRARMISEHAARGMFPIHTKFANAAPKFILTDLSKKVRGLDERNSKEKMEREQTERDLQALMIEYGVQNSRD